MLNFRCVQITAKSPRVDDWSPLDLEAEHDATMDDNVCWRGYRMDILHEEEDLECKIKQEYGHGWDESAVVSV